MSIFWKEEDEYIDFDLYDVNNNGLYDTIEWNTPHLSLQQFYIGSQAAFALGTGYGTRYDGANVTLCLPNNTSLLSFNLFTDWFCFRFTRIPIVIGSNA